MKNPRGGQAGYGRERILTKECDSVVTPCTVLRKVPSVEQETINEEDSERHPESGPLATSGRGHGRRGICPSRPNVRQRPKKGVGINNRKDLNTVWVVIVAWERCSPDGKKVMTDSWMMRGMQNNEGRWRWEKEVRGRFMDARSSVVGVGTPSLQLHRYTQEGELRSPQPKGPNTNNPGFGRTCPSCHWG